MTESEIHVAIVGTGAIGKGWAALIAAAGWPVSLYDNDGGRLDAASQEISRRAWNLVRLRRADPSVVEAGLERLRVGRSLLEACRHAQWIIESVSEDLRQKQKLFESLESAGVKARAVTSSSDTLAIKEIASRAYRRDRCLIVHPLNPPELIPLVEVVPSAETDKVLVEVMKAWLRALGRIPVTLKKNVPGNVVGRITAAVWREAIDLVLDGVVDAADLDRAVSAGPAVGWAAAGPLLSGRLAAGEHNTILHGTIQGLETLWTDLADWKRLEATQRQTLVQHLEREYEDQLERMGNTRDRRLAGIMRGLEGAREDGARTTEFTRFSDRDE